MRLSALSLLLFFATCSEPRPPRSGTDIENLPTYLESKNETVPAGTAAKIEIGDSAVVLEENDTNTTATVKMHRLGGIPDSVAEHEVAVGTPLGDIFAVSFVDVANGKKLLGDEILDDAITIQQSLKLEEDQEGALNAVLVINPGTEKEAVRVIKDSALRYSSEGVALNLADALTTVAADLQITQFVFWLVAKSDLVGAAVIIISAVNSATTFDAAIDGNPGVNTSINRKLSLAVKAGSASVIAPETGETILVARVTDLDDKPIAGETVSLEIPTGGGSADAASKDSDEYGNAEFTITASAIIGAHTFTAKIRDGLLESDSVTLSFSLCSGDFLTNAPFANWQGGTDPGGVIFICTKEQLNRIADGTAHDGLTTSALLAREYNLQSDIDLEGVAFNKIGAVIDYANVGFSGVFTGNGYTISNLSFSEGDNLGMFAWIENGTVTDLNVVTSGISTEGANVGVLAGSVLGAESVIDNVHISGKLPGGLTQVIGKNYTGGFAGKISGASLTDCSVTNIEIKANQNANDFGGFAADLNSATVKRSFVGNNTKVSAVNVVGGFAGSANNTTIQHVYSHANVEASGDTGQTFAGGLFALISDNSNVSFAFQTGNVCEGECKAGSAYDDPLIGYNQENTSVVTNALFNSTDSGWAESNVGKAATKTEMTTDSNGDGIIDAFAGWDTTIWNLEETDPPSFPTLKSVPN